MLRGYKIGAIHYAIVVLLGFLLRVLFLVYGAELYYGEGDRRYVNNDSFSYSNSITNFIEYGQYTHTLGLEDAAFGRLPLYPIFWGLHYLLFGESAHESVAISQILLDTLAIWLFICALHKGIGAGASLLGGMIYATYPFVIVWTTITGTELLGSFLTVLIIYLVARNRDFNNPWLNIAIGVAIAMATLTRSYMVLLLPIVLAYSVLILRSLNIRALVSISVPFLILFSLWPLRNYFLHDKNYLLHPPGAGYPRYAPDVSAARSYILAGDNEIDKYLDAIADPEAGTVDFPESLNYEEGIGEEQKRLVSLARDCGSGFNYWNKGKVIAHDCNQELESGFESLRSSYIKDNPFTYYTKVPLLNFKKAFFKNELSEINREKYSSKIKESASAILFSYRSVLVVIGFLGIILAVIYSQYFILVPSAFAIGMYLFICVIFRQLEMRYLLQADILLLIPAVFFLIKVYDLSSKCLRSHTGV